ncbi:PaaI family thioesterase [Sneathiella marina]|uniref:PaaI family thioesterase n=1 Tax=Sneathiella marina TaxID=2950108 RepID=A0ABY4W735_9PROT|nr:PaaI family thioesterase [Sneathiella marina]USG60461.1 PaaI family thioesterase [Sneathiella marina]
MTTETDFTRPSQFLHLQPFANTYGVTVVDEKPGSVVLEAPYLESLSTLPDLFPTSSIGAVGDMAAISSCMSMLPKGWACATLDFTVKMTGQARGEKLIARGRVLQAGKSFSVGSADVYTVCDGKETLCGVVMATGRNFPLK